MLMIPCFKAQIKFIIIIINYPLSNFLSIKSIKIIVTINELKF